MNNIQEERWQNNMPNWLNAGWSALILAAFVYGLYAFGGRTIDKTEGIANYKDFIIPAVSLIGYAVHFFIYNLFANADVATTMMVALIFIAIITGLFAASIKDKETKSFLLNFATGFGALGLAIPFGEKLRNSERNRDSTPKTKINNVRNAKSKTKN